jgi:hypothetical protein
LVLERTVVSHEMPTCTKSESEGTVDASGRFVWKCSLIFGLVSEMLLLGQRLTQCDYPAGNTILISILFAILRSIRAVVHLDMYGMLNPWSRVLAEKLTGPQLFRNFPAFYGTGRFITAFTRACHLLLWLFRNMVKFLRWGVISTSPNPQVGGPPLVSCRRLLIQYIRSCLPYLEAVSPSATWGCAMTWWQGPKFRIVGYI